MSISNLLAWWHQDGIDRMDNAVAAMYVCDDHFRVSIQNNCAIFELDRDLRAFDSARFL